MTGSINNSEYLKQSYQLNNRVGEPQAFELLRSFGQKFLETQSWPSRREENWKYTSTQIFSSQKFAPSFGQKYRVDEKTRNAVLDAANSKAFANSLNIIFVNGIYDESFLNQKDQAVQSNSKQLLSIRVLNIKSAIEKGLYPIFDLSKPLNSFEALNLSFLEEGVFIDIPDNTDLRPVINLAFISTEAEKQNVSLPRVIIKIGKNARATVFENYATASLDMPSSNPLVNPLVIPSAISSVIPTGPAAQWTNSQVEIHLQKEAQLSWARLQDECASQFHTCRTKVYQEDGAQLHILLLSQGANLHRHDLAVEVNGENANTNVYGISLGTNKEHRDHNTVIEFNKGNSKAEQIFKSILHGESKSIFNGKIIIKQDSQKVDSSQLNQSLILSEKAEANSQPQLEIYADDVKATHGATIGQLSEEELFYFKSRGISETKAKLMMTQGFAIDLVERFPDEEIKILLRQKITTKLQGFW